MHQSFVNLNAVRRRAAAQTAAELEQKRLQQEQEQQQLSPLPPWSMPLPNLL
jgi:hypothetical protein